MLTDGLWQHAESAVLSLKSRLRRLNVPKNSLGHTALFWVF